MTTSEPAAIPPQAITAHDAYWRVKEVGGPPPFESLPLKLQQCWAAAAQAVAAAERERAARLIEAEMNRPGAGGGLPGVNLTLQHVVKLLREQP